jgi:hypothetical protein
VAGQFAGHRGDAGRHHQVTQRRHGPERTHRHHVAEQHEPIVVALEAPAAAQVDVHELCRPRHAGIDHGLRSHRHGAVGQHDQRVHGQAGGQHPHPHEVAVPQGEGEQDGQGATEQPATGGAADHAGDRLEHDAGQSQDRRPDDRVPQVGAEGRAQDAERDAHHGGEEDRDHGARRYRGRCGRSGRAAGAAGPLELALLEGRSVG